MRRPHPLLVTVHAVVVIALVMGVLGAAEPFLDTFAGNMSYALPRVSRLFQ
jgi:hypothetical protein